MKAIFIYRLILFMLLTIATAGLAQPGDPGGGDPDCPTLYTVGGGGHYCAGGIGVSILLNGSNSGVAYQLKNGSTDVGLPVMGGNPTGLTWSNITAAGIYTVDATNPSVNCTVVMNGSATIIVDTVPAVYVVSGTGNMCQGGWRTIVLSGSQAGINYQLLLNGTSTSAAISGTDHSLNWANISVGGTYTVVAINPSTGCSTTMNGNAVLSIIPIPMIYGVAGNSVICQGETFSRNVVLQGSQTGVNYQLKKDGVNVGVLKAGTGATLTWGGNTTTGTYTVVASSAINSGCAAPMSGSAIISTVAIPTLFAFSGGGTICSGAPGLTLTLSNSETGVNYQLVNGEVNTGLPKPGTGASLNWTANAFAGTYKVVGYPVVNSGCRITMTGSAVITVNVLPTLYTVSGTGNLCAGDAGLTVALSNSQTGVNYQLKRGSGNVGATKIGTGAALTWDSNTTAGTYTVTASDATTSCTKTMLGSAIITVNALPAVYLVTGGTLCTGSTIAVGLSGSQSGVNYQLKLNGANQGAVKAGTGNVLSWPDQSGTGTYTVLATGTTTLCAQIMTGSASLSIMPTQFTVGGGGTFCSGSGLTINLSGSQSGVNYQLKLAGASRGAPIPGTGAALTFPSNILEGNYSVNAINTFGCTQVMTGSATITVNPVCPPLENYAFRYKYDSRKRMVQKKVPGAAWVYMVYDSHDRLVMTQDGEQRKTNRWTFIKYDVLNRPIITGIYTHGSPVDQATMSGLISTTVFYETYNGIATTHGYTNAVFSSEVFNQNGFDVLMVTYYDDYNFRDMWNGTYTYLDENLSETANGETYYQPDVESARLVNRVTGTKTKVLDAGMTGEGIWLNAITYYDEKYRPIQTISDTYYGDKIRVSNVYDFAGKVLQTKTTHYSNFVQWKDIVGVTVIGDKIFKSAAYGWGNGGAVSVEMLSAGSDGWAEFTLTEISTIRAFGFSASNVSASYNIDFGFYIEGNVIKIQEGFGRYGSYLSAPGDVFRVSREAGKIYYYKNGVQIPQTAKTSVTALMVDVGMLNVNSKIKRIRTSFSPTSSLIAIKRRFEYDHTGRLTHTWHKLNDEAEILLSKNQYNELGQLVDKKLHSTTSNGNDAKQSVDYRYNIRGWLTSLNDASLDNTGTTNDDDGDFFGMNLAYNNTDLGISNTAMYNGNISGITWSNHLGQGDVKQNAYTYNYDPLNRIIGSSFKEKEASWSTPANNVFAETGFTYDMNGNIKTLQRNDGRSSGWMDNLVYTYTHAAEGVGNKPRKVTDNGDDYTGFLDGATNDNEYTYDANGNLVTDLNKGIATAITYNHLNLPVTIARSDKNKVTYVYDAIGNKVSQQAAYGQSIVQTDYVGEFQYRNGELQFINHEEGRIMVSSQKEILNHQGNTLGSITTVTSSVQLVVQNGAQTYVKVTANGNTSNQGIYPIGETLSVQAGERYLIRAKGYKMDSNEVSLSINGQGLSTYLPSGFSAEAWIEQIVVIPAGYTTLQAGLLWNTVSNGQRFLLNDFQIIKLEAQDPEYQYHLKDHLGNVRTTFTTKDEEVIETATLETANENAEAGQFLNYDEVRSIISELYDKTYDGQTPPPSGAHAQRLSGSDNEKIGLAKSLSVMPGDKIGIEVFAKYYDPDNHTNDPGFAAIMNAIISGAGIPANTIVDGLGYAVGANSVLPFVSGLDKSPEDEAPKAYLNWLVFDRNYVQDLSKSGFKRITTASMENGTNVPHDWLKPDDIIEISKPGYVYIWLSNENEAPVEVYFDDFKVTHTKSPVIATDDYYPSGAMFNSYTRENSLLNRFKYQSKEWQTELGLELYDFGRPYDPWRMQTITQDAHAERYYSFSPYSWAANNPLHFTDPTGMDLVVGQDKQFRKETKQELQRLTTDKVKINKSGEVSLRQRNGSGKELGTSAIRQLVNSDKSHGIFKTEGKNSTSVFPGGSDNPDINNGKGATALINYNPKLQVETVTESGESKVAPNRVILGHELIHASHIDNGTSVPGLGNPNGSNYDPDLGGGGVPLSNEEINTRSSENVLRREQGVPDMRASPVSKDAGLALPEIIIK